MTHEHDCEHGHEHEHCEHEHGHEHTHDHCGHGHGHEHGHCEHEHRHGHDDHCDHDHVDQHGISLTEHEGALIASLSLEFLGDYEAAEAALGAKLAALAEAVTVAGGIVGHIKATLSGNAIVSTLSTTGSAVHITRGSAAGCQAEVVVIVLAIGQAELRGAIAATLF